MDKGDKLETLLKGMKEYDRGRSSDFKKSVYKEILDIVQGHFDIAARDALRSISSYSESDEYRGIKRR